MTWGVDYLGLGAHDDFGVGTDLGNVIVARRAPSEATPIFDAVRAAHAEGACPGCGREVHRRPDGGLVRHKVTKGGEWCTAGR